MKFFYPFVILFLIVITQPCCNNLPDGGIPIYLKIDTVNLDTNFGKDGYNSQAISDAWAQTSTTNLGTYQIPVQFPVLQDSTVSFLISAGVFESGQSEIRDIYPFYTVDTFTLYHAVPGKVYTHTPVFNYLPSAQIPWIEDFETSNGYDSITLCSNPSIVKYGHYCGQITVSPSDSSVLATQVQNPPYTYPSGQEIWLELDYMSQVPFWIGINGYFLNAGTITSTDNEQVLFTLPQAKWTHIYVKLSEVIAGINASFYRVTFQALNPSDNPGGSVYLDNIKMVYFP